MKKRKRLTDKRWMLEFSKKMLVMLSVCYALMLVYVGVIIYISRDTSALPTLVEQVTIVFSLGVVSYLIKSAVENVFKIKGDKNCNNDIQDDQDDCGGEEE